MAQHVNHTCCHTHIFWTLLLPQPAFARVSFSLLVCVVTSHFTRPCSAWPQLKVCVRAVCFFASLHSITCFPPSLLCPHGHYEPILTLSAPTLTTTPTTLQSTSSLRPSSHPSQNRGTSALITSGGSLSTWRTPRTQQVIDHL